MIIGVCREIAGYGKKLAQGLSDLTDSGIRKCTGNPPVRFKSVPGDSRYALKAKWARTTLKISKVGQDHFEIE